VKPNGVTWFVWATLCLLLVVVAGPGQISQVATGGRLKFPDYYESQNAGSIQTNRLRGLLMAAQGHHLSNDVSLLTQIKLEHYQQDGRTNLVAQAAECVFEAKSRVASSTGRVEIVGMNGAVVVQGQSGFQVRMTNSTMTVSNHVRTVIRRDLLGSR